MNGLTLLVAMAALAVDFGWDTGPGGQLWYTIRIEPEFLKDLRTGEQAVMSPQLDVQDRGLRRFQVIMGPRGAATTAAAARAPEKETLVQYGWRAGKDGGLEYLVQMTPERLETLANGVPLICEVDPQVPEINCIYVYAGVGQVPRSAIPTSRFGAPLTAPALAGGDPAGPAIPSLPRRGSEAPRTDQTPVYDPRASLASGGFSQGQASVYDDHSTGWRNDMTGFGASTAPRAPDQPSWSNGASDGRNNSAPPLDRSTYPSWSNADNRVSPVGYDTRTAQRNDTAAPPANYAQRPASEPARQETPAPAPQAPVSPAWQTTASAATPASVWNQAATATAPARSAAEDVRPWTPLILTTLGLFASLGANAYLGWLAWSFFWRYRDTATELGRSRVASSRQAA